MDNHMGFSLGLSTAGTDKVFIKTSNFRLSQPSLIMLSFRISIHGLTYPLGTFLMLGYLADYLLALHLILEQSHFSRWTLLPYHQPNPPNCYKTLPTQAPLQWALCSPRDETNSPGECIRQLPFRALTAATPLSSLRELPDLVLSELVLRSLCGCTGIIQG